MPFEREFILMHTRTRIRSVVAMAAALMMVFAGVATADDIVNDVPVDNNVVKEATIVSAGTGVTVQYWITHPDDPDDDPECDANTGGGKRVELTPTVPAGIAASVASVSWDSQEECREGVQKSITFTSSTPGTYSIGHSVSWDAKGGPTRTMDISTLDFALNVRPRPAANLQTAAGDARVDLTWDASPDSGIDGYKVYQAGVAAAVETTASPSAEVTGLTNGTEYCFTVKAYKGGLESDATNEACATPVAPMVTPPAPSHSGTFLKPVDGDGVINIVKQGRTVPVKLEIYDGAEEITTGSVSFTQRKGSCSSAADSDPVSEFASTNNTGNAFRFVTEGSQDFWQFNLNTKNVALGCNNFDIWLGDSLVATFILNVTK